MIPIPALRRIGDRHFHLALGILCLFYLTLQILYVTRLPLVMDEFAGMVTVLEHRGGVPYRDFTPYKTVLGYYLQAIPTFFTSDTWGRLIATKIFLAILNTLTIFWAAGRLARHLNPTSVLAATLLLVCMSTFLERSSELRVDMLTAIGGLVGLIWLLDKRVFAAGIATGVALLISQKAVFFVLAGAASLGAEWLRGRDRRVALRDLLAFSGGALVPLVAYLGVFSLLADAETVFRQVFLGPSAIAFKDLYDIRHYWAQTIGRNPLFWGLSVLSILLLLKYHDQRTARVLSVYGTAMLLLGLWHKQPWPYFFVILIPTCYVLLAAFFDHVHISRPRLRLVTLGLVAALGVALPLTRLPVNLERDSNYQRYMIDIAEALLDPGESYFAGVELLPAYRHTPHELRWLDRTRRTQLQAMTDFSGLIAEMRGARLKLVIHNNRFYKLPEPLLDYIDANYQRLVGGVMIYAPSIPAGTSRDVIILSGKYRVVTTTEGAVVIDDQRVAAGETIELAAGEHRFAAEGPFRLQLQTRAVPEPHHPSARKPQFFFPNVYRY